MKRYERSTEPLAPLAQFLRRVARSWLAALGIFAASLGVGVWGYRHFEGLSGRDAFLNASMLLSGMGPVHAPQTDAGKIFAGCYALFSGLAFAAVLGFMISPIAHRLLHKFHLDDDEP